MNRRGFFKLLGISPAVLLIKPKHKYTTIRDCIDPEVLNSLGSHGSKIIVMSTPWHSDDIYETIPLSESQKKVLIGKNRTWRIKYDR